jgi:hypothetical protein
MNGKSRRPTYQPVSRPGDQAVPADDARELRVVPAGLLEKLVAAVRPEFRVDDLVFDPRDPVLGGPRLRSARLRPPGSQTRPVPGPPAAVAGLRRAGAGGVHRDDHRGLARASPPGGLRDRRLRLRPASPRHVPRHTRQWDYAGRPDLAAWRASPAPLAAPPRRRASAGSATAACGPRARRRGAPPTMTGGRPGEP